jgi:hypothetical protein
MKRLAALLPLMSTSAFAQCVMCFRTAAAQQSERAKVLNAGIIIMLLPPLVILSGFVLLLYVRRKTYADAGPATSMPDVPVFLPEGGFESRPYEVGQPR